MTAGTATIDTESLRTTAFPLAAEWAYLTHAPVRPLPQRTLRRLNEMNHLFTTPHIWEAGAGDAPACRARESVAGMTGAAGDNVAFVSSAAHGISICAAGID